jgi:hypothetical protein
MNTSLLTNHQLFTLSKNRKLTKEIRFAVKEESKQRGTTLLELEEMELNYNYKRKNAQDKLELHWKFLVLIFPFVIVVHNIVTAWLLDKGYDRKFRQYWLFVTAGLLIDTIILLVLLWNSQ